MSRLPSRALGFTLVELIVAIVLLGLLAVVGTHMVSGTMIAAYATTQDYSSGSQARYAMERMVREIREMQFGVSGYSITSKSATSLEFTKENGTVVRIRRPSTSDTRILVRYASGTEYTLTDQLTTASDGLTLEYLDQLGATTTDNEDIRFVRITMKVKNTKTGGLEYMRTRVFLRNAQMSA